MTLPLDNLLERVSRAARNLPGAVELYLFGSAADPATKDPYSDLDLQVVTADFALSRAAWLGTLTQAGRIKLAYPLVDQPHEMAFCVAFENESPYHKVDIGLSAQIYNQGFLQKVPKKVLLWQQMAKTESEIVSPCMAFLPEIGTPAYFLVGELLGSVRYLKARKRGHLLACWRFVSAKFNALLRSYLWDGNCEHFPKDALTTWDFTELDRRIPEADRLALLEGLNFQSPDAMDLALLDLTRKIADRLYPQYQTEATPLSRMVREYVDFIERELAI